jgi:hypothetical protein
MHGRIIGPSHDAWGFIWPLILLNEPDSQRAMIDGPPQPWSAEPVPEASRRPKTDRRKFAGFWIHLLELFVVKLFLNSMTLRIP